MASDLTVVFYTANRTTPQFAVNVQRILLEAIGDLPLISVSQTPMPGFGENICIGTIGQSYLNIYRQILVGCKAAKTPYVAFAEDDVLYPPSHFTCFRPPMDAAGYNMNRWNLLTWSGIGFNRNSTGLRHTNVGCIAPTELVVAALEERFAKYPNDGMVPLYRWMEIGRHDNRLGVTSRRAVAFESPDPLVVFFHEDAVGYQYLGRRKRPGDLRRQELPYWGSAQAVMALHHGSGSSQDVPVSASEIAIAEDPLVPFAIPKDVQLAGP